MAVIDTGTSTAGKANVDAGFNLQTTLPTDPAFIGAAIAVSQIDDGSVTGTPETKTIDEDDDFNRRIGGETMLDSETFDYTAQNTGKQTYVSTTLTFALSAAGMQSNAGASVA